MLLSLVIPVYNEAAVLPVTLRELREVLGSMSCEAEIIFVDDGSRDGTRDILDVEALSDRSIKVIHFSRNFGHQAAVTAGLDYAVGDAVIVMDADLQDPPGLIPKMLEGWMEGYQVVSPQRVTRMNDTAAKRWTAASFYWLMKNMVDPRLVPQVGDFRLFSREAVRAIRQFREQHRFMRGLVAWLGLREKIIPFERMPRAAGETKYPFWKMVRFAWTAISSFSAAPLRLSVSIGFIVLLFGVAYSAYSAYQGLVRHATVPGWTSLICLQTILSGTILLSIGLVGDYVARIYEESKARPLYVVGSVANVADVEHLQARVVTTFEPQKEMSLTASHRSH
jgi:glycosyltransferase involved in cell wall biosynthesis